MRSGITRQALRRHRWSLVGPCCTQVLAALVVASMVDFMRSVDVSLSPAQRTDPAVTDVLDAASVFLGDAVYLTFVLVAVTMSVAVGRQLRDIALLRTVGASPGQIRRSMAAQAAVLAVPAVLAGTVLAVPASALWLHLLRTHGVLPAEAAHQWSPISLAAAMAAVVPTSVLAAWLAALRTSRMKPAGAMVEVGTTRRATTRLRIFSGAVLVVAGVVLSTVLSTLAADQMADAGVFVMLAECIGVGLLSPLLLRAASRALRRISRSGTLLLAADDLEVMARPLSGALIPLVLALAFAAVQVGVNSTSGWPGSVGGPTGSWIDYSGSAIFCAFATVAALNCLATVVLGRSRDLALVRVAGASRRRVLGLLAVQVALVTVTALLLAALVALVVVAPLVHTTAQVWVPRFPVAALVGAVVFATTVVAAGMMGPGVIATRRPPMQVIARST